MNKYYFSDNRKNNFSIIYKVIFSVVIFIGILDRARVFSSDKQLHTLYSFTTISNFYIMIITLITLYRVITISKDIGYKLPKYRTIGVMMILITGLIYHFILLPNKIAENANYQIFTFGNIMAHYMVPLCAFLDWLLFDKKGRVTKWEPFICTLVAFVYFVVFSIYGYYGSIIPNKDTSYVYFFMDWSKLGVVGVIQWAFLILISILFITYFIYLIDHLLAKKKDSVV